MDLKGKIRTIENWPKKGIMFRDITTLLQDKEAFEDACGRFYNEYWDKHIEIVVGIESRGFIFGAVLANMLKCAFVPVRKEGKLPYKKMKHEYSLEYGNATVEIHQDSIKEGQRVLIVDDLLATGGTCLATIKLVEMLGGKIIGCAFLVELPDLKGKEKIDNKYNVFSIIKFGGEN